MSQKFTEPDLPVVVIAASTLSNLQRLGAASPVSETKTIFEAAESSPDAVNPLLKIALDKLRSAELLVGARLLCRGNGNIGNVGFSDCYVSDW